MNVPHIGLFLSVLVFLPITILLVCAQKPQRDLSIGERFHEETSLTPTGAVGDLSRPRPKSPPPYKSYSGAQVTKLPPPDHRGITVEDAIRKRRSVRDYSRKSLTLPQLSQLLFAAQGITGGAYGEPLRAAPSAGALYPYEVYVVANGVDGVPRGIYHYAVKDHALELVRQGDFRQSLVKAGLDQEMLGKANVTFVLTAMVDRTRNKYGERGFRYIYIEAGHISQNIALQSVSLGLGSVCVGAFLDEDTNRLIGVDGKNEVSIYLHAVGIL